MASRTRITKARWLLAGTLLGLGLLAVYLAWRPSSAKTEDRAAEPRDRTQRARNSTASGRSSSLLAAKWRLVRRRAPAARGRVVFRADWGSGRGQLGRKEPSESSPEGPASFAVDGAGRVYVLDQVNGRIQVFAGNKVVQLITLPGDTFEDIALTPDGSIAVLDRLARRSVSLLDARGRLVSEVDLVGRGVPEGGAVTGLFVRDDGLWVEVAHQRLVRIADASGQPDPKRPSLPGRFSADGRILLQAALNGRHAAEVITHPASPSTGPIPSGAGGPQRVRLDFPMRIAHLTALESDAQGRMYLGALMMRHRAAPPFELVEQSSVLVVISPSGRELKRITLSPPTTALSFLRSVRVSNNGTAWHLAFDARGATLRRYDG